MYAYDELRFVDDIWRQVSPFSSTEEREPEQIISSKYQLFLTPRPGYAWLRAATASSTLLPMPPQKCQQYFLTIDEQ